MTEAIVSSACHAAAMDATRYAFRLERFNELSGVFEPFQLLFYDFGSQRESEIEVQDIGRKRRFLARCTYPQLGLADLRVGARVTMWVGDSRHHRTSASQRS
jgi:hypothetical protein